MTIDRVTLNDPEARSADPVAENVSALKALFPAAMADGRIDFDTLRQLLGDEVDDGEERYGLNWPGKRRARRLALTPSTGTLRPAREDSVNWDTTRNLMIEGDNLEVLKLLQKSYAAKVKLIYIDPPYNTNRDRLYKDDYSDPLGAYLEASSQADANVILTTSVNTSGRYHSHWLSMMLPRLMNARTLMSDEGLIVISIDDNELSNLIELCNQVFGADNIVAILPTVMNLKGNQDQFGFAGTHEYTVVFAKDIAKAVVGQFALDEEDADAWEEDDIGPFKRGATLKRTGADAPRRKRPHGWFPIFVRPDRTAYATETDEPTSPSDQALWPITDDEEMSWRWSRAKVISEGADIIVVGDNPYSLYKKQRPALGDLPSRKPKTLFYKPEYSSGNGTSQVQSLLGCKAFSTPPKPIQLIGDLLELFCEPGDTVIDFFAGSGTTAHAAMVRSAMTGAELRWIAVQLPEPLSADNDAQSEAVALCQGLKKPLNLAEVTKQRLRVAAKAVRADHPRSSTDLGFRVYQLATSNLRAWEPGEDLAADLLFAADNIVQGRTEEDLLTELLLKQGIDLTEPMLTEKIAGAPVHAMGGGVLVVCLAPVAVANAEALADGIADWILRLKPVAATTVFFKDAGFENDVAKANVAAILEQRLEDQLLKVRSL